MGPSGCQKAFVECVSHLARVITLTISIPIIDYKFYIEEKKLWSKVKALEKVLSEVF